MTLKDSCQRHKIILIEFLFLRINEVSTFFFSVEKKKNMEIKENSIRSPLFDFHFSLTPLTFTENEKISPSEKSKSRLLLKNQSFFHLVNNVRSIYWLIIDHKLEWVESQLRFEINWLLIDSESKRMSKVIVSAFLDKNQRENSFPVPFIWSRFRYQWNLNLIDSYSSFV